MNKRTYISYFLILAGFTLSAQEKDQDNIGTETVTVTSAYRAQVNDAFKIQERPDLNDEDNQQKIDIDYQINSVPVASTFQPEKGQAAKVDEDSLKTIYNNHIWLRGGNYSTFEGELSITEQVSPNLYLGGNLSHLSSYGDIEGVEYDNEMSRSNLNFYLGNQGEKNTWKLGFGTYRNMQNWYGISDDALGFYPQNQLQDIDLQQIHTGIYANGLFESYHGILESVRAKYQYFSDDFDGKEHQINIRPDLRFDIANVKARLGLFADYVGTESDDYGTKMNYKNTVFGAEPSVKFHDDTYSIELGLGLGTINSEINSKSDNRFVVYPKVALHVDVVKDIVMFYGGVDGGVRQNSYANLAKDNPFVAPVLEIKPTFTQYNAYVGMKGKLYHNVAYNIKASYKTEDDKQLFVSNPMRSNPNNLAYGFGNSFGIEYDIVSTFTAYGELNLEFFDDVSINLSGEYNSYDTKNLTYAYNLPETKLGADVRIDFTPKWFAGIQGYWIGSRYDRDIDNIDTAVELDSFVDMNAYLGYRPTEKWTVFAKANNLFNSDYNYWQNYPVQGFQVSAGAMYKFNF
ncbi:MAG TPA: TonB-dependent receptor [Flavobacterium sp.]|nr:TonB-dependent receptor [Flavobacterium sp.]